MHQIQLRAQKYKILAGGLNPTAIKVVQCSTTIKADFYSNVVAHNITRALKKIQDVIFTNLTVELN